MPNYPVNQLARQGQYVQQTPLFDVTQFQQIEINSENFKMLMVQLARQTNEISLALNNKPTGQYLTSIYRSGNNWFQPPLAGNYPNNQQNLRPEYQLVVEFGALPNTATKQVAHNIPIDALTSGGVNTYRFVEIKGCANKPDTAGIGLRYIPLPYSSATLVNNIEVYVDNTYVTVVTAADYSAFTSTTFVLRFLQS